MVRVDQGLETTKQRETEESVKVEILLFCKLQKATIILICLFVLNDEFVYNMHKQGS